jgi:hypothetical protein
MMRATLVIGALLFVGCGSPAQSCSQPGQACAATNLPGVVGTCCSPWVCTAGGTCQTSCRADGAQCIPGATDDCCSGLACAPRAKVCAPKNLDPCGRPGDDCRSAGCCAGSCVNGLTCSCYEIGTGCAFDGHCCTGRCTAILSSTGITPGVCVAADGGAPADMAPPDMAPLLHCSGLFTCISNCTSGGGSPQTCASTCGAQTAPGGITLYNSLVECLNRVCAPDAGNRTACLQGAIGPGGACLTEYNACSNDK